jgi:peptidoglycan/LPS O-acetylase OafA/YrhL
VIDGLRAIAILLVLCDHFVLLFPAASATRLWRLGQFGQTGVDLFFVISGFLITRILLDAKGSPHVIRNFYVRRALRITPLYYLTLLALFVIAPAIHAAASVPWDRQFWFWLYLQGFPLAFNKALITGPTHLWSLAVEEHFYLVWPFFVVALDAKKLYKLIAAAVVVSLACRVVWPQYDVYYFTLARLDGIAIGAAIAIYGATHHVKQVAESFGGLRLWARVAVVVAGGILAISFLLPHFELSTMRVLRSTLVALVYAGFLVMVVNKPASAVGKLLQSAPLRSIAKYSYAMYMFHPFIFEWLKTRGLTYSFLSLLLGFALTYAAGWVSWNVLEKPILRLKHRFEARGVAEPGDGGAYKPFGKRQDQVTDAV